MRLLGGRDDNGSSRDIVGGSTTKAVSNSSAGSRLWLGMRDPRIVRVSRAFGGKDRHSKVSTIKGLRDRRVRLSVPTAIQLYDLQDRLGLNQPSKVVDWLLNAARDEIDKLPPLPIPPSGWGAPFPGVPQSLHPVVMTSCEDAGYIVREPSAANGSHSAARFGSNLCYNMGEPGSDGNGCRFLSREEDMPPPPLSLLPSGSGEFAFCLAGGTATTPVFPAYISAAAATANSYTNDFSDILKSTVFGNKHK